MNNSKYPFKFLDSYSKDDVGTFFGRDEEIDALYQMVFQSNILLVYGASGTGKTSLIQCGLAGKFQEHDWQTIYVRRAADLNTSLNNAIIAAGGTAGVADLAASFRGIYLKSFRPLYLIFDQFEELFIIHPDAAEQLKFIKTVKEILALEQPVKMIFSVREEYIGNLYDFEKAIPQLLRKKLRVEPMNRDKVKEVILRTIKGSAISIQNGEKEDDIAEAIFNKVKGKDNTLTIQLPYLQVFLKKLYTITKSPDNDTAIFSIEAINNMADIADILRGFLEEQVQAVSDSSTGETKVSVEDIWDILSPFATLKGTKAPITMSALLVQVAAIKDKDVTEGVVRATVKAFSDRQLIKLNGDMYELAHDSLAGKIAERRSVARAELMEVQQMIISRMGNGVDDIPELFSEKQLTRIDACKSNLDLTPAEIKLIDDSSNGIRKKKRARIINIAVIGSVLSFGLVLFLILFIRENAAKVKAESLEHSSEAFVNIYTGEVTHGFRIAQKAYEEDNTNNDAKRAIFAAVYQSVGTPQNSFYKLSIDVGSNIYFTDFSHNGKMIITRAADTCVKIWNAATGIMICNINKHTNTILSSCFSPDDKIVLTASRDHTAKTWDAATGKLLHTFQHDGAVSGVVYSRTGDTILTRSEDSSVRMWNANTGALLKAFKHKMAVGSITFSPDYSRMLILCKGDSIVRVWEMNDNDQLKLYPHPQAVTSASFSPDGNTIVTACNDKKTRIWSVSKQVVSCTMADNNIVLNAIFSPDGKKVATTCADNTARIWDVATGSRIDTIHHDGKITSAVFSPVGNKLLTTSYDLTAKIWDPAIAGNPAKCITLRGHKGFLYSGIFSPDERAVLTISYDMTGRLWEVSSGREEARLTGHLAAVCSAVFAPDSQKILTRSFDMTVKLWDINTTNEFKHTFGSVDHHAAYSAMATNLPLFSTKDTAAIIITGSDTAVIWNNKGVPVYLKGHTKAVKIAAYAPGGTRVITASDDSTAIIWDATNGKRLQTLAGQKAKVTFAAFSRTADTALTVCNNTVILWDVRTGKPFRTLVKNSSPVGTAFFSPDGTKVLSAHYDGYARLWSVADGSCKELKHSAKVTSAVFSHDGKKIASVAADTAKIWNVATGQVVLLKGHIGDITSVSFSNDDTKAVTASYDNTAKIWDATTGNILSDLTSHTNFVNTAFFSPDGTMVVTSSDDHTTRIWDVEKGKELAVLTSEATVHAAYFSPYGKHVVAVCRDGTANSWLINIPDIIAAMDKKIARSKHPIK